MNWKELLKLPVGATVEYDEAEISSMRPIVEFSETVRPYLMMTAQFPHEENVLITVTYDTEKKAYQAQMRYRESNGEKRIAPASRWFRFRDEKQADRELANIIEGFQKKVKEDKALQAAVLRLPLEMTDEELIKAIVDSGLFSVVEMDKTSGKAKKIS